MSSDERWLEALLGSWDRNNTILVNLVRALHARTQTGSPAVGGLFAHVHYVRMAFLSEDAPDFAREVPAEEWRAERDLGDLAAKLNESAKAVRDAVKRRLEASR
jgi:hypothetical protein